MVLLENNIKKYNCIYNILVCININIKKYISIKVYFNLKFLKNVIQFLYVL